MFQICFCPGFVPAVIYAKAVYCGTVFYGYVQTSYVYAHCILAACHWVKYCIFCAFSKILKMLWSSAMYFAEQIQNKNKSGTDKLRTSIKHEMDGLSIFVVCYPSRVVFLCVCHAQYEVSLTKYLPFVVGSFKLFLLFLVGCLVRVCRQGSETVDRFLLLTRCCNVSITRRLAATQQCIIFAGVFEVDSAFALIYARGKCIIGDDFFFLWQPLISGGSITQKLRYITASHTIIKWGDGK